MMPILEHYDEARRNVRATIRYNETGQRLDVWGPKDGTPAGAPVMLFIPGGGWMIGRRRGQSHELMAHLVAQGWVCVSIDYRTAPVHQWPAPFLDVMSALQWTHSNIEFFGGDPGSITLMGASAGGHMASLAGLIAPEHLRPRAVVSLYGVYDWMFRGSIYHLGFGQLLEKVIVGKSTGKHSAVFRDASPIYRVHPEAPPFLLVHGTGDWLTPVGGARRFAKKLNAVSHQPVHLHEIRGAQHAFDLFNPEQSQDAIHVIDSFLNGARRRDLVAA